MISPKKTAAIIVLTIATLCLLSGVPNAGTEKNKLPKFISIASYPIGSHGTLLATAFCNTIEKKTGIRSRPIPADTQLGRILPIKTGEAQVAVLAATSLYFGGEGIGDFATKNWGPQKLRLVFSGNKMQHGIAVKANSDIKSWADLKGKKVTNPAGLFRITTEALLAYGNLSEEDVVLMNTSGYVASVRMVMDGTADACHATPLSPKLREWEAAPYGLRWLEMDDKDIEAWNRLGKIAPFMAASTWTTYGALGEGGPKWLAYYPNTLTAYDTTSEEVVYLIVKAMVEGIDLYKDVNKPATEEWTIERTLDLKKPIQAPFHPGLIKYAKEINKWTPEHEKWQSEALKKEEIRIKNWTP